MTNTETYTATDRYRCPPDLLRISASEGKVLIYSHVTQALEVLPVEAQQLLGACDTFKTLDEHAQQLCEELYNGSAQMQVIRQDLSKLAELGFLMSHQAISERFAAGAIEQNPPPISAVAIPVRNRTDGLARSLQSYASCGREYERHLEFFVADQSDDIKTREANLSVLAQAKKRHGYEIYYGGPEEKEALARRLAQDTGYPFDVINFAVSNDELCPKAYGANRNALLLSTVGSLIIQADDDSECKVAPSPDQDEKLVLTSQFCALQNYFLSESEMQTIESRFSNADLFAVHEQLLGKSLANCIADPQTLDMDGVGARFFRKEQRQVWVTLPGSGGESAIGTSFYFLNSNEKERESIMRSEEIYQYAMANHNVIRFVTNPTISDGSFCYTMNIGLDNRRSLPPFTPVQRNEDGVFGELIAASMSGYIGFLPWLILHNRTSRNTTAGDLRKFASTQSAGGIFAALVREFNRRPKHADPAKNLISVGKLFADWGSAPLVDFEEMLRLLIVRRASQQIGDLEHHLKQHSQQPDFWARDVDMCLSAIHDGIRKQEYYVAGDLSDTFGEEEARKLTHRLVRRFGELLQIWPDLRESASQLQQRGWQPFRKI